jgi:ubiquinone/menaquinone biosynthesis C-methylase UbiE
MLFPTIPPELTHFDQTTFVLPKAVSDIIIKNNTDSTTGTELRLQDFYTHELWKKIYGLGLTPQDFKNKTIIDICSGTGFLSYHLLKKCTPAKTILTDISATDLKQAQLLLQQSYPQAELSYIRADINQLSVPDNSIDIIIGNSFIHHFYDVPELLAKIQRLLKPGGVFISLHEPLISAIATESRNPLLLWQYLAFNKQYIEKLRPKMAQAQNIGCDVWLFTAAELRTLLSNAGFVTIRHKYWHMFRSLFSSKLTIHLTDKKKALSLIDRILLTTGVALDGLLNNFLGEYFFGSISFMARK